MTENQWTVEELDLLHEHVGLGKEWRASDRRAELVEGEQE